jgi:MtrB/PioB family decaheme-associated outer membrane protein
MSSDGMVRIGSCVRLAVHGGGRVDVQYCVMCHNSFTTDANSGNVLTMSTMTHKLHSGRLLKSKLDANQGGEQYVIWGFNSSQHDSSEVGFPQDLRNCTVCHSKANASTPQGDNWKSRISKQAYLTCHANGPTSDFYTRHAVITGVAGPRALPPDSQAHSLDLTGNYTLATHTRAHFKLACSRATQDQDFAGSGLAGAPAGVTRLVGKVNTTLAQVGISSRPLPRLLLLAEARYQDKDDNTPIALYNTEGAASYTNRSYSLKRSNGELQATYQIAANYQGTLGAEYEKIDRGDFTATSAVSGVSALRLEMEETTFRAELRRRMTETFSGSVSFITSDRDGSNWLRPNSGRGVTEITDPATGFGSAAIFSPTLADRRRDKIKVAAAWQPTDALSLQLSAGDGKDRFSAPTEYALRKARMDLCSLDVGYTIPTPGACMPTPRAARSG